MDCKKGYEPQIDLKDLMFHVLYRWRPILVVAVMACVLAIGCTVLYNEFILPDKRGGILGRIEEQKVLVEGLEEGQPTDWIQKRLAELQEELDGLSELNIVKHGIIGLMLGLCGLVFCFAVSYVLSDRMRGERELLDMYGYYLLGTFPRQRKGKDLQGFDRSLEEWEGNSKPTSRDEVHGIIAMSITNLAKDGGMFLMTGTVDVRKMQKLTKDIIPLLQKNAMLTVGADMNRTAGTLAALGECDAVILVEERGESLRGRIQREHECIAALGKPVVGYVVL